MRVRTRWIAGLWAAAVLLTATVTASGYTGQVEATATVAVRGTVTCHDQFTVTATFLDLDGAPVAGLSVDWSFGTDQSDEDTIHESPTITNEDGVATTRVTLAAVTGERRIGVTSGQVSASGVVSQACGGLPRTSTLPADAGGSDPALLLPLTAFAVAAGASLGLWRRRVRD